MKDGIHPDGYTVTNKQTNADRIRSMTDEELALAIVCPAEYDLNFNKNEKCNGEMNKNCYECSLKWLQEEREEQQYTVMEDVSI